MILSHKGTVGRVAFAPEGCEPFVCSPQTTLWRAVDRERLDPNYLYAQLRSPLIQKQLHRVMHESDMAPYVSLTSQRQFAVSVPPIDNQRVIALVLGKLDDKIDNSARVISLLARLIAVAYGKATLGAAKTTLGELGAIHGGGTPKTSIAEYWDFPEIPWVTPKDMTGLEGSPCVWKGSRGISRAGLDASSARLVPAGSVLYTSRATLGLVAIAQQPLATNQGFITVIPRPGVSSAFVLSTLVAQTEAINAKANGSTFLEVNKTNFKQVECRWPSERARMAYDAVAEPALRQIAASTREAQTLTAIRDALLPKLVSGQIRVPLSGDPEEQVGAAVEALG